MASTLPELGTDDFSRAWRSERTQRSEQRRARKAAALAALHAAQAGFRDYAGDLYAGGAEAADRDGETLEALADRLLDWLRALEPEAERLQVARDQAGYRGPILTRRRAPFESGDLAERVAETLGEALLSDHAQAVLIAAVKHSAA
jgi:hypothetical protein